MTAQVSMECQELDHFPTEFEFVPHYGIKWHYCDLVASVVISGSLPESKFLDLMKFGCETIRVEPGRRELKETRKRVKGVAGGWVYEYA